MWSRNKTIVQKCVVNFSRNFQTKFKIFNTKSSFHFKGCHYFYTSINAAFIVTNWQSAGTGFEAGIDEPITT